jgi:hypothetical protein
MKKIGFRFNPKLLLTSDVMVEKKIQELILQAAVPQSQ